MRGLGRLGFRVCSGMGSTQQNRRQSVGTIVASLRHAGCQWSEVLSHPLIRNAPGVTAFIARNTRPSILAFLEQIAHHPLEYSVATGVLKCAVADGVAQAVSNPLDSGFQYRRFFTMLGFGAGYIGLCQHGLYSRVLRPLHSTLVARGGKLGGTAAAVALDQGIVAPFIYMGAFSGLREMGPQVTLTQLCERTVERWKKDVPSALPTMWTIWVPAQIANYAFVPKALSVPYINAVGLVWGVIMSLMMLKPSGKDKDSIPAGEGKNESVSSQPSWDYSPISEPAYETGCSTWLQDGETTGDGYRQHLYFKSGESIGFRGLSTAEQGGDGGVGSDSEDSFSKIQMLEDPSLCHGDARTHITSIAQDWPSKTQQDATETKARDACDHAEAADS